MYKSIKSKLFVGVLAPKKKFKEKTTELKCALEESIGTIGEMWQCEDGWIAPASYVQEMGEDLSTVVFVFDGFWHPTNLAYAKRKTLIIEKLFAKKDGKRNFNINPGMVDINSMRLASHKPSPIRYQLENYWIEEQMKGNETKLELLPNIFQEYVMGSRLANLQRLANETLNNIQNTVNNLPSLKPITSLSETQSVLNRVTKFFTK